MIWSSALAVAFCALPSPAEGAVAGWQRQRTCLTGVTPHAAAQRKNITVDGVNGPLKIGYSNWESGQLLGWISRILIEEVLGINVELTPFSSSNIGLAAVSGCQNPARALSMQDAECDMPGPPHSHIQLPVWQNVESDSVQAWLRRNRPAQFPLNLGSIGYSGQNGFFLQGSSTRPAMQRDHLLLEYCKSFADPRIDVSSYFDSVDSVSASDLAPCSDTTFGSAAIAQHFLAVTDDFAGVNGSGGTFTCTNNHWWIAPACRANTSKCIPVVSGGYGWEVETIAQRAVRWEMPLALAIAKDWTTYTVLPKIIRSVSYWWFPDVTFLGLDPVWLVFPPHNPEAWASGVRFTGHAPNYVGKWGFFGLENRGNTGTDMPLQFMRNLKITTRQIVELMNRYLTKTRGDAGLEQTVCEWANSQRAIWEPWVPVETNCLEGQGLVNETGGFPQNRTAARRCAWCPPGRVSAELNDAQGLTYQCEECPRGKYQGSAGLLQCDPCEPGTAAPDRGMASCARCGFAEYVAAVGAERCEACPRGFVTSFKGAQSPDACVCPAGKYRDAVERDRCLDCPSGMVCPVGMDALGFRPDDSEQQAFVPQLKPGFWSSAADVLSVFRCEDAVRCRGGAPGDVCSDKLKGRSCQHCVPGFFWSGEGCIECDDPWTKYLVFPIPVLPCLILLAVIVGGYRLGGAGYAQWDRWQNGITSILSILLHHYHLVRVIQQSNTPFSEPVVRTMNYFTWSGNPWSLVKLSCSGLRSFISQMLLQSLAPMFIIVGFAAIWGASQLVGRRYPAVRMEGNRTFSGCCSIILTFFTSIADMALTVFKCARNPNGKYSLVADRSILCYEGEWNRLLALGVTSVLLWCGGILLVCMYAIWSAPLHFHRTDIQARWKFLFVRYRVDVHWWALVIVLKSIIVNMVCVVLAVGVDQLAWIFIVLLLYLHVTSCYRPWRSIMGSTVDIDVHLSLLLVICASMTWFAFGQDVSDASGGYSLFGEILLRVAICAPPVFCLPFMAMTYVHRGSRWARAKKKRNIKLLTESIHLLAKDDEKLSLFLSDLSEPDWQVMVMALDAVQQEFVAVKCRRGYSGTKTRRSGAKLPGMRSTRLSTLHGSTAQSTGETTSEDGKEMESEHAMALGDAIGHMWTEKHFYQESQSERTAASAEPAQDQGGGEPVDILSMFSL